MSHCVRTCRKAFGISGAFIRHAKLTADYGNDGQRGGTPSFAEYMATTAGQAERLAFADRCTARFKAALSEQPPHLLEGSLHVEAGCLPRDSRWHPHVLQSRLMMYMCTQQATICDR